MFKQGTKSIFTIILKDIWAQPGSKDNTWWITISETQGSKTFQIINCSQGTGCQRQFNPYYKQPDLSNAIPTFCAVFSTTNLCTTIIQFLSSNELSIAYDSPGFCQPVFPQSLYPQFLETVVELPFPKPSAVLHTGNHLKKGTSLTAKPVFGTQWNLNEPSGAKSWLSWTDVDHLVKKIKIWRRLQPHSIRNTEKGFTPIWLTENSEFEKK